jgi:hypothetical protein
MDGLANSLVAHLYPLPLYLLNLLYPLSNLPCAVSHYCRQK